MNSIFDYTIEMLEEYFLSIGEKKFKAKQVFEWLYQKRVYSFDEMSNLSINLREKLKSDFSIELLKLRKKQDSEDTSKYLFELYDGNLIESVLMRHDYGISVCVSSQIGCNMGCSFCSSGILGKQRNLLPHEMVGEILVIILSILQSSLKINSILFLAHSF